MNHMYKITLVTVGLISLGCYGTDLQIDSQYIPLKAAIDKALSIEKIEAIWNEIMTSGLSPQESKNLACQAITYAQQQTDALRKQRDSLGDKNYDSTRIGWGLTKIIGAKIVDMKFMPNFNINITKLLHQNRMIEDVISTYGTVNTKIKYIGIDSIYFTRGLGLTVMTIMVAVWLSGIWDIYQGSYFKQNLETKITNLTKIIEFMQPLTK